MFRAYLNIRWEAFWIHHWNQLVKLWSTIILAGERYVAIAYPFKVVTLSSKRNTFITLGCLIVTSALFTLPRLFELDIKERPPIKIFSSSSRMMFDQCVSYNKTVKLPQGIHFTNVTCHVVCGCPPSWINHDLYRFWYRVVLEASFKFTLPFLLLLGFNVGIIRNLIPSFQFHKQMANAKGLSGNNAKDEVGKVLLGSDQCCTWCSRLIMQQLY